MVQLSIHHDFFSLSDTGYALFYEQRQLKRSRQRKNERTQSTVTRIAFVDSCDFYQFNFSSVSTAVSPQVSRYFLR
ncbi:hypothetical protein Y032_0631g867 [Ancylostoma ceylanicum]|uniref:Uncharacterized protein n=1 Tax=Ancylostoma ceylanicum TaxID=53326 RepID=A0A016WM51_9BILA|nr:hypothetical protein Y032_0631g867 [Ancylostoma ceylanicum]